MQITLDFSHLLIGGGYKTMNWSLLRIYFVKTCWFITYLLIHSFGAPERTSLDFVLFFPFFKNHLFLWSTRNCTFPTTQIIITSGNTDESLHLSTCNIRKFTNKGGNDICEQSIVCSPHSKICLYPKPILPCCIFWYGWYWYNFACVIHPVEI